MPAATAEVIAPKFDAKASPQLTLLSDHAVHEPVRDDVDAMELHSRVGAVYDLLRHKDTRCPMTVALYGDWGSGKTSAMRWLQAQLLLWNDTQTKRNGHPRAFSVWFDPWKYQSREDVWRGLIGEVILSLFAASNLDSQNLIKRMGSAAKQFGAFWGRGFVHALANITLKIGDAVEFSGEAFRDIHAEMDKVSHPEKAYLNQFEATLRQWVREMIGTDDRLVIFVDDLDRCLPDVTLEVLEAIKRKRTSNPIYRAEGRIW